MRPPSLPHLVSGAPGAASSVSAWRTFLIANEWNEIQTHRKVYPSLQLFAVLLFLEVVGLKNLASRDLNVSLQPEQNTYHAPWSPILRFGIAASVWLVVGIVQMLVSVGFYQRFVEDKIHQFIDLCSLSNVSVFLLTHRCYGFYIHGRSIHGHADVGLDTMVSYLRKEEVTLLLVFGPSSVPWRLALANDALQGWPLSLVLLSSSGERGWRLPAAWSLGCRHVFFPPCSFFGPSGNGKDSFSIQPHGSLGLEAYSEVQTFEVLLTDRTRTFYDRVLLSSMENKPICSLLVTGAYQGAGLNLESPQMFSLQLQRGPHSRPDLHEQRLKGYHALNRFLVSFLEHRHTDMDYVVKDKFFLERIMDMEFQEPGDLSVLYNDDGPLFSRTLFYGHELLLLLFETLLFCAVDFGSQNFVLSTVVTFAVQKLVQMVRNTLGRRNLAEKTLVEKQFLI
ncbi:meckelin-like [Candoia aspera]|uniref:meckelin-like n=1 Tax=Candoia aspera TaxID=51853 RepID=UPI002FD7C38D